MQDQWKAELAACNTIPAVERWEDETWATIPIADGPTNTLVLRMAHQRKCEIRGTQ